MECWGKVRGCQHFLQPEFCCRHRRHGSVCGAQECPSVTLMTKCLSFCVWKTQYKAAWDQSFVSWNLSQAFKYHPSSFVLWFSLIGGYASSRTETHWNIKVFNFLIFIFIKKELFCLVMRHTNEKKLVDIQYKRTKKFIISKFFNKIKY